MMEVWLLVGVGAALAGLVSSLRSAQVREAQFEAMLARQGWRKCSFDPEAGQHRRWAFSGRTAGGVDWEVCRVDLYKSPTELCFRAVNLKLPRLEMLVGRKSDLGKLKETLPQIEKMAHSFVWKLVMAMAEKYSSRIGASLDDLLDFFKAAEEKPVGSREFQAHYSVLTRGSVPLEKVLTVEAQAMIEGWRARHFHLSWGSHGLTFHIRAGTSQCYQLGPEMVRLGELLTGSSP